MKRIYLDYASTTPVDPAVEKAMRPYFTEKFGNPGSLHFFGQEAMAAVDESREKIAKSIGADFREIIFTGSATEANNLALRSVVKNVKCQMSNAKPRIIVSSIEHESILETCKDLEVMGIEVTYLPVDKNGLVDLVKLKKALNKNTVLVSIMYANNEIGTIQPIAEISEIISDFRVAIARSRSAALEPSGHGVRPGRTSEAKAPVSELAGRANGSLGNGRWWPLLHTDAVQAFQYLDCDVNRLGVDLMTFSAHKIYGPKGIGALYVRQRSNVKGQLSPVITGGGQEFGLRSGTENVPFIAGFAKAVELVMENKKQESERTAKLRDYFWNEIKKICPKAEVNGGEPRLPNNLSVYLPNHDAQDLLMKLDLAGVAVSSGSACSARSTKPSHVLKALGYNEKRIKESVRFTFGRPTAKSDLDEALKRIKNII